MIQILLELSFKKVVKFTGKIIVLSVQFTIENTNSIPIQKFNIKGSFDFFEVFCRFHSKQSLLILV